MKNGNMKGAVFALVAIISLAGIARAEEKDVEVKAADLPAAVKETVDSATAGAEIKKIEKGDEDGKTVDEVTFVKDGKKAEATISPEGKLMSIEEKVKLDAVPAAVLATLKEKAGGAELKHFEKITADGKVSFEAQAKKGDKVMEYSVAEDGKFVGEEDVTKEKD